MWAHVVYISDFISNEKNLKEKSISLLMFNLDFLLNIKFNLISCLITFQNVTITCVFGFNIICFVLLCVSILKALVSGYSKVTNKINI